MGKLNDILIKSVDKCEQLKKLDLIQEYNIELKKENERLCLDDMITEFDAKIDITLMPKRGVSFIENKIIITKKGINFV